MTTFRIEDFIDRQTIAPIHIRVLALCTVLMFIDGFDVFMVGKIAPAIAAGFGETPAAMTLVFVLQQVGLAVGAFAVTPLSDRWGRRRMLAISGVLFGVLTLASVFAQSLFQLAVLRGLSGVFLSAVLPTALALVGEVTPRHRRASFITVALAGYSAGAAAGAAVAAWLIDLYGWQSGFWIGGLLPLACVPLILLLLPESLQYMVARNRNDPAIPRTLRRFDPGLTLTGDELFEVGVGSARSGKASVVEIFRDGRARTTIILWLCCLLSMGNIALLAAWLPTFFQEMGGIPIQRFAISSMIAFGGGVAGTLVAGVLMDRYGATRMITAFYIGIAASLVALGQVPFEHAGFNFLLLAWAFFQSGGQAGLNTLIVQLYPASARSTGLGWAGGAGRIGGVISPVLGGLAVSSHLSLEMTLLLVALVPIGVVLLVLCLRSAQSERERGIPATA
jgi:AAHS family 4-hydroxybenzoate transporter-like MFS transporter